MADKRISQLVDRGTVVNNDVIPIVVSGASTTNKATISSIQTFMQGNLDVGVTSVGITLGSSGTDVNVSGSPVTSSGNITINLPTASAVNRGALSSADWTTFNSKQQAITLTTTGTSGAATLVSGTLNIPNYSTDLSGYVTLGTTQTITAQKTFTTSGGSDSVIITTTGAGFALDAIKAGNGEVIRVNKTSGTGNAMTVIGGNFEAPAIVKTGGTSAQFLKADGSVDSSTYLTTASATAVYVPYTGANSGVNLGQFNLSASSINVDGPGVGLGSYLGFKHSTSVTTGSDGYTSMYTFGTNTIGFKSVSGATTKDFSFSMVGITAGVAGGRIYTLPDASGTVALTSNLSAYLPLAGGTLTGALSGTSASFSDNVTVSSASTKGFVVNSTNNASFRGFVIQQSGTAVAGMEMLPNTGEIKIGGYQNTGDYYPVIYSDGVAALTFGIGASPSATFTGALNGTSATFTGANYLFTLNGGGSTRIAGTISNTSGGMDFGLEGAAGNQLFTGVGSYEGGIGTNNAKAFHIATNGTSRLSIASTGAATFSAATAAITLTANGAANQWTTKILASSTTSQSYGLTVQAGTNASDIAFQVIPVSGSGSLLQILGTGAATFSSSVGVGISPSVKFQVNDGTNINLGIKVGQTDLTAVMLNAFNDAVSANIPLEFRASKFAFQNGNVGIGTASPGDYLSTQLVVSAPSFGGITIASTNATNTNYLCFARGTTTNLPYIGSISYNHTSDLMAFATVGEERMRITSGGNVLIGQTTASGVTNGIYLRKGIESGFIVTDDVAIQLARYGSNGDIQTFYRDNTKVGSISVTTTATSYNTSSDYRLKENVKPVENALSTIEKLKPCTFNFITESEEEVMGFLAHEVQEVIPQAVKGEKDAVKIEEVEVSPAELDEEGNIITEAIIEEKEIPVYQGIDHSKLVPLLVASIQELKAEIDSLKNQIK